MTNAVKNFIETNYILLDTDPVEFFHSAYNGLSISQQKELVTVLEEASIPTQDARETFIRFHITMTLETLERPVTLRVLVARFFDGILGFDADWIFNYILDNENEWDVEIALINGTYYVYPST